MKTTIIDYICNKTQVYNLPIVQQYNKIRSKMDDKNFKFAKRLEAKLIKANKIKNFIVSCHSSCDNIIDKTNNELRDVVRLKTDELYARVDLLKNPTFEEIELLSEAFLVEVSVEYAKAIEAIKHYKPTL
jgi:hypothetical protein